MADMLLQVTIAATGVPQQISKSLPANNQQGNAVFNNESIFFQQITFQNNGSNPMRLGDRSVSATRGIILGPSGSNTSTVPINYSTYLSDWWLEGTAGDVCDILYIK
jgi:hypothetical protein